MDPIQRLQHELQRTKEEKDTLAAQYRNLLSKLTTMRTTLGNKLKQDADELDRQEQLVQQLTVQNDDLSATVEALKAELITSNEESERASRELEVMRSRALQENAQEAYQREREVRELQAELEQSRIDRDEWEDKAMQSQVVADEARLTVDALRRDLEIEREARERDATDLHIEREKCNNLQSVLEDFQAAKDHELQQALKGHEVQLLQVTQSLAEYKHRALTAEMQLEESNTSSSRTTELEKEVKEKNLLISKLRHEAVIMNDHLMEALRRLRRSSTDTNVDRRLVTNVLLSFLNTPRADSKRFEMLSLLSSILSWNDDEREKAGLQKKGGILSSASASIWGRATSPKGPELEKIDETEVSLAHQYSTTFLTHRITVFLPFVGRIPAHGSCIRRRCPTASEIPVISRQLIFTLISSTTVLLSFTSLPNISTNNIAITQLHVSSDGQLAQPFITASTFG
ncbi:hypothetical protein EUX98_g5599 [Antrodiella citrinella]|uniref:GRIP domain-containing protein n=1 Tax=Antrodiella citrinella TaxID=2447956 RepID=A0A4S4MTX5_9APHY|nr:hypothetical protein EUX98_g5599 [Antrodiella citrinella]